MTLKLAIAEILKLHKRVDAMPPTGTKEWAAEATIIDGEWHMAQPRMESIARTNPAEAWDIFRMGSDDEFAVLVNSIMELGRDFETDDALREVMRIAKRRGTPNVLEETRLVFGSLFDRYWANDDVPPIGKARTFTQVRQATGA